MDKLQVSYVSLKEHKQVKRLWLEGLRLEQAGFSKGIQYQVAYDLDNQTIKLIPLPVSQYIESAAERRRRKILVVAGRKRRGKDSITPIIDICNAELINVFGEAMRVRAIFKKGEIEISLHHEERKRIQRETRIRENVKNGTLTEGTACAGIGVATHAIHAGLTQSGIQSTVEWIVDRDSRYIQVAQDHNDAITDDTSLIVASLEELDPDLLDYVDIAQFSLPCTGHSKSGKVKNKIENAEEHDDATSVVGFFNILHSVNPAIVISENVVEAQNSATYMLIRAELNRLGYNIYEKIMDHTDAGTFEHRKRYWFVAVSKGLPTVDLENLISFKPKYQTLSDFMEDIPDDHPMWSQNQYLKDKALRDQKAGKGFANRQLLTPDSTHCGTIGRHYNKRRSTEPFIVDKQSRERTFTPCEHSMAKGIPLSLIGNELPTIAHEGLGQSILYNHGVSLGLLVGQTLQGKCRKDIPPVESKETRTTDAMNTTPDKSATQNMQMTLFA